MSTPCFIPRGLEDLTGPAASPRKLGLLAGVFEDGTVSIFVVPYPADVASAVADTNHHDPTFSTFGYLGLFMLH